jgi:hypothetical protein
MNPGPRSAYHEQLPYPSRILYGSHKYLQLSTPSPRFSQYPTSANHPRRGTPSLKSRRLSLSSLGCALSLSFFLSYTRLRFPSSRSGCNHTPFSDTLLLHVRIAPRIDRVASRSLFFPLPLCRDLVSPGSNVVSILALPRWLFLHRP